VCSPGCKLQVREVSNWLSVLLASTTIFAVQTPESSKQGDILQQNQTLFINFPPKNLINGFIVSHLWFAICNATVERQLEVHPENMPADTAINW
jgi:hypothetical protein